MVHLSVAADDTLQPWHIPVDRDYVLANEIIAKHMTFAILLAHLHRKRTGRTGGNKTAIRTNAEFISKEIWESNKSNY